MRLPVIFVLENYAVIYDKWAPECVRTLISPISSPPPYPSLYKPKKVSMQFTRREYLYIKYIVYTQYRLQRTKSDGTPPPPHGLNSSHDAPQTLKNKNKKVLTHLSNFTISLIGGPFCKKRCVFFCKKKENPPVAFFHTPRARGVSSYI